jgi:poly-gamma-glutamate capsule biosynthesis protein CapA/YwtB (metallophosphatase superfamily)
MPTTWPGHPLRPRFPRPAARPLAAARLVVTGLITIAVIAPGAPAPAVGLAAVASPALAGPGATVTLAFAGDVHFAGRAATLLRHPGASLASLRPYLAAADVAMVNLETAVTERGTPAPKQYRFRTPASAYTALSGAGIDVVTMANNHAVDYGAVGLDDTLAARRRSPVRVVGIGSSAADAYAPAVLTVRGRRVALLGASQLLDWTLQEHGATATRPGMAGARPIDRLLAAVRAARKRADIVVVYLHWGTERATCPDPAQQAAARAIVAAGADAVVGSHAHVVQGSGWLGRGFVAYGLGNFVWYNPSSPTGTGSGVLTLTVTGRRVTAARWTPLVIGADGVPRPPARPAGARLAGAVEAARGCTGLAPGPPRSTSR